MIATIMAKSKAKTIFTCQNCGAQRARWEGRCSDCGAWNTFVEETFTDSGPQNRGWSTGASSSVETMSLDQSPKQIQMKTF